MSKLNNTWDISINLIDKLNTNLINYCHWKSNINIDKALCGYDDLDLLVDRKDINKCQMILSELRFKEAINDFQNIYGVKHFYGLDKANGEILHVHLYVSIITGPSWTKGYTFNIEEKYLSSSILHERLNIRLPKKEYELSLFLIRICLKITSSLEAPLVFASRNSIKNEIEFLLENSSFELVAESFNSLVGTQNNSLLNTILNIKGNIFKLITGSFKVRFKLRRWRTLSRIEQLKKSFYQLIYRVFNKIIFKEKKKLTNGGAMISFVGLDASGKSTMLNETDKWLSKYFNVKKIHFGRPESTMLTLMPNIFIILYKKFNGSGRVSTSFTKKGGKSSLFVLRQLILAYDRYSLILKARKLARKGNIILIDRFKSENRGVMDSHKLDPDKFKSWKRYAAILENGYYDKIGDPHLILHLEVPINVALKRNRDRVKLDKESDDDLKLRYSLNQNLNYSADNYYLINSNKDFNIVVDEIKTKIWNII